LSENILRNSGQLRALLIGYDRATNYFSLKPKFIIDKNDELKLIEIPRFETDEYIDVLYNPEQYLSHEFFLPDGPGGAAKLDFPYTLAVLNIINHFHVQAWLWDTPWYLHFYEPDHPANGLRITAEIMLAFHELAIERGQTPVLTVIPTGLDLKYFNEYGAWPYDNLLEQLSAAGMDTIHFGPGIIDRLDGTDPCSLFDKCNAHYNEQGYGYLAEIAYEELERRGLAGQR